MFVTRTYLYIGGELAYKYFNSGNFCNFYGVQVLLYSASYTLCIKFHNILHIRLPRKDKIITYIISNYQNKNFIMKRCIMEGKLQWCGLARPVR